MSETCAVDRLARQLSVRLDDALLARAFATHLREAGDRDFADRYLRSRTVREGLAEVLERVVVENDRLRDAPPQSARRQE